MIKVYYVPEFYYETLLYVQNIEGKLGKFSVNDTNIWDYQNINRPDDIKLFEIEE